MATKHCLLLTVLMFFVLVAVDANPRYASDTTDIVQRVNYGVIFKEESHLYMTRESWLHTFEIALPKAVDMKNISFCNSSTHDCNTFNNMINFINHLHSNTEIHLRETINAIHALIPQSKIFSARNLRSLLPFIGSLAKGLFGTATMGDVELLARHINILNKKTQIIAEMLHQHGDHLSSFMALVDNRTSNLVQGIQANANEIKIVTKSFQNSLSSLQQSMINMSELLITVTNKGNMLQSNLNQMQAAVQSLVEGRISPLLLPKHILTHALHRIQGILTKNYRGFYLTHFHPSYYYSNSNFMFTRNHSMLYLTLRFPVSSHAHPLRMYKIIALPVPVNNSLQHATQLLDLPDYFAITSQHDYYLPLSSDNLANCEHGTVTHCNFNIALTPSHVPQCTIALFNNDVHLVSQFCNFRYLENHLRHDIIELTPTSVLVYQSESLALDCPDKQKVLPGCQFCIVNLPCKCALSSVSLYLSPRLVNCFNSTIEVSVLHPVNLALLQEIFDESKLDNILANTLFPSQVQLSVPNFKLYSHNMSSILAADQQTHLSLKKMAAAARKEATIFKTLTEPLLDGQITLSSDWPDLNAILIFVALGIATFSTLFCIYLFFKTRKMATAMLILQGVVKAKSQTVPSFIYHKVTQTPSDVENSTESIIEKFLKSEFSWIHASVVLSIIVLIFLLVLVCYLYKSRKSKCTTIILEITSGGDCITVPILSLSLCPSYYDFTVPVVEDISISAFPQCKLFMIISSFQVKNKLTSQTVNIPTTIGLNLVTRYKIQKILQQPFNAFVLVTHQGYATLLNNPDLGQQVVQQQSFVPNESTSLYPKL